MSVLGSLEDISKDLGGRNETSSMFIQQLLNGPDEERRIFGYIVKAAIELTHDGHAVALHTLRGIRNIFGYQTLTAIHHIIGLCRRLGNEQLAAFECLKFADDCIQQGYDDLALEASAAALILDGIGDFLITKTPSQSLNVASMYEYVSSHIQRTSKRVSRGRSSNRLRVGLLVPNLVDNYVAYTKRILQFAQHIDRSRYELRVFSSENHAGRTHPFFPFGPKGVGSMQSGIQTIEALKQLDVPVLLGRRDLSYTKAACELADEIEQYHIDVLLLQTGLSAPIDWIVTRISDVPVKMSIHIGSTLFMPTLDATIFDNPSNITREESCWADRFGDRVIIPKGVDVKAVQAQSPYDRKSLGIPKDAVVIGTMSNHLAARLTRDYCHIIIDVMNRYPEVYFVAFGSGSGRKQKALFEAEGVSDRVCFPGQQQDVGAALAMLDIYAVEFPVGGSQSVLEAMACGIPVLAMRWSHAHAESSAAELIGEEFAVRGAALQEYRQRLIRFIEDSAYRRYVGNALKEKCETIYRIEDYLANILEEAEKRLHNKTDKETCSMEVVGVHRDSKT